MADNLAGIQLLVDHVNQGCSKDVPCYNSIGLVLEGELYSEWIK